MWVIAIIIILILFVAQMITVLIFEYKNPSKTVAWIIIMIMIPIIGAMLYYYLARSYKHRRTIKRHQSQLSVQKHARYSPYVQPIVPLEQLNEQVVQKHHRVFAYLESLAHSPMTCRNETTILADCREAYAVMLAAIAEAVDHIHLQFYTIRSDRVGRCFQSLLIAKSLAGVKVRVLYDGLGSYKLDPTFIREMKEAGIEVSNFLPPLIAFFDKRVNYRNHRKTLIVDGKVGFMGGMNIGEEYVGGNERLGYWRDTHLRLRGDAVYDIQNMFLADWSLSTGQTFKEESRYYPKHHIRSHECIQIVTSGPDEQWDHILELFFVALSSANKCIYLTSPYYIPEASITMALKTAALSGVDVRLIIPYQADSRLVQWASLSYMEEIMQAGVKCYLYRKGFIHSKVLIVDEVLAAVGSANMDMRSFFSNFECNAMFFDSSTIATLINHFKEDQSNSTRLELHEVMSRSRLQRTKEVIARLISPLL